MLYCAHFCVHIEIRDNFSAEGYLPTVDNFTKLKIYKKEFLLLLYKNMLCAMCVYSRVLCMSCVVCTYMYVSYVCHECV